jgi:hypothetical protein
MRNRFSSHLFPRIELEQKYSRQQGPQFFHAPPPHPRNRAGLPQNRIHAAGLIRIKDRFSRPA